MRRLRIGWSFDPNSMQCSLPATARLRVDSSVSVMRICDSYRIWDYLSEWSERVLLNGIVAPQQRQSSRGQSILVVRGGRATHG